MSRRTTGTMFVCLSGLLYATRFIAAAIYGSSQSSWSADLFKGLLRYTDQGLTTTSIAALVAGIFFLVWAEISRRNTEVE